MNKLIKLSQDKFILVSDEKGKEGKNFNFVLNKIDVLSRNYEEHSSEWNFCRKIIAGIPELPRVDLSDLKEEDCKTIGWVDVEKLASLESVEDFDDYAYNGFIKGFKTAQSLNDKMFSLDDMRKAFEFGLDFENGGSKPKIGMSIWEEFIESLQQTEWDVEVEMEGCSDCHLDEGYLSSPNCCRDLIPKITNNSIKVIKIL